MKKETEDEGEEEGDRGRRRGRRRERKKERKKREEEGEGEEEGERGRRRRGGRRERKKEIKREKEKKKEREGEREKKERMKEGEMLTYAFSHGSRRRLPAKRRGSKRRMWYPTRACPYFTNKVRARGLFLVRSAKLSTQTKAYIHLNQEQG